VSRVQEWLEGDRPVHEVHVLARPDLWPTIQEAVAARDQLQADLERQQQARSGSTLQEGRDAVADLQEQLKEAHDRVDALWAEAAEHVKTVKVSPIPYRRWLQLQHEHPPTQEDRRRRDDVHRPTFEPAMLAAAAIEPQWTEDEWQELLDSLPAQAGDHLVRETRRVCEVGPDPSRLASASTPTGSG